MYSIVIQLYVYYINMTYINIYVCLCSFLDFFPYRWLWNIEYSSLCYTVRPRVSAFNSCRYSPICEIDESYDDSSFNFEGCFIFIILLRYYSYPLGRGKQYRFKLSAGFWCIIISLVSPTPWVNEPECQVFCLTVLLFLLPVFVCSLSLCWELTLC